MAGRNQDPKAALPLLRALQKFSPMVMFFGAGLAYYFADDGIKAILAASLMAVGIIEFFVFGVIIRQIESQR